jgi:hypothetical protein
MTTRQQTAMVWWETLSVDQQEELLDRAIKFRDENPGIMEVFYALEHYSSRQEIAEFLGVSTSTLARYQNEFDMPSFCVENRRFYLKSEIKTWMEQHRVGLAIDVVKHRAEMGNDTALALASELKRLAAEIEALKRKPI